MSDSRVKIQIYKDFRANEEFNCNYIKLSIVSKAQRNVKKSITLNIDMS